MRASLPVTLLLSVMLAACASTKDAPVGKPLPQNGPLKVHPGLLGQPLPTERTAPPAPDTPTAPDAPAAGPNSQNEAPIKLDQTGLRTQRSVYFDLDSATVKDDYLPALLAHAQYLAAHPKSRIRIEGNADERGPANYNNQLGKKRAANVRQAIIAQGAAARQVSIRTLGASQPKLKGHDEESWAENRRSDVVYEKDV